VPFATSGSDQIFYREQGTGEPLLLIHGWPASSNYWEGVMGPLAERRRVIAIDLKGFGQSDKPDIPAYRMVDLADDVNRVLDHLGINSTDVVAHSMGGMVAYCLALRHPARVRHLVVVSAPVYGPTAVFRHLSIGIWPPLRRLAFFFTRFKFLGRLFSRDFTYRTPIPDAVINDIARITYRSGTDAQVSMQTTDLLFDLTALTQPTLIIHGDRDRVIQPIQPLLAKSRIPNSRLEVIPHCGHCPGLEEPTALLRLIWDFLPATTLSLGIPLPQAVSLLDPMDATKS
jgi:pimeloyl-ACP methyl ester carboxylesterase